MSLMLCRSWFYLFHNNVLKPVIRTKDTVKRFAQTGAIGEHNEKGKIYNFDLRYAIRRFDPNFKHVKPLLRIESEKKRFKEPVIIFPGFEGRIDSVEPLIHNLNRDIYCLQYPFEKSKNRIPEIAAPIIEVLKAHGLDKERLNILGHSFGGIIALEAVRMLETEGKNIRLCLTDSTPYAMKVMTSKAFGDIRQTDEFETNLLINIGNCLEFHENKLLATKLSNCVDWQEKTNAVLPVLAEKTHSNVENLRIIANGIYNILQAVYFYNENDIKLESETTLIRSSIKVLPLPEDFKTSKFFQKTVKEFFTDGHHLNMLKSPKTASLINGAFPE